MKLPAICLLMTSPLCWPPAMWATCVSSRFDFFTFSMRITVVFPFLLGVITTSDTHHKHTSVSLLSSVLRTCWFSSGDGFQSQAIYHSQHLKLDIAADSPAHPVKCKTCLLILILLRHPVLKIFHSKLKEMSLNCGLEKFCSLVLAPPTSWLNTKFGSKYM